MPEPETEESVLIVDDDERFRERLSKAFADRNWQSHTAPDAVSAVALALQLRPALCLVDLRIHHESGVEIVRKLRALDASACIIMMTGYGSISTAVEAIRQGANYYITKPMDVDQILSIYQSLTGEGRSRLESAPASTSSVPTLDRVEWEHIQRVLNDCGGNISQAARLLDMHRRSLQRKLSKNPPPR